MKSPSSRYQGKLEPVADDRIRVFSELAAKNPCFDVTNDRAMAALHEAEDQHFWHRARNEWIANRLHGLGIRKGHSFLELGCGGGCVSAHLSLRGLRVVGVEGHRQLLQQASRRAPEASFWLHDLSRGVGELPNERFDAAGLFDVLEHLDSPLRALNNALRMVVAGGLVVGTVPAMMRLWSRVDEQAGHRTRYDERRLRALVGAVDGSFVEEVEHLNRLLVPLLWARRLVMDRKRGIGDVAETNFRVPPKAINQSMVWLLRAEREMSRVLPLSTVPGSSLWFAIRRV